MERQTRANHFLTLEVQGNLVLLILGGSRVHDQHFYPSVHAGLAFPTELTLHRVSKKTSRGELRWHDLLPLLNTKTLDCHLNLAMLLNPAKPMKFEFDVPSKSRLRFTLQVVASMCRQPEPFLREPEASSSVPLFPTLSRVFQKFSKFPQLTPSRSNSHEHWLMIDVKYHLSWVPKSPPKPPIPPQLFLYLDPKLCFTQSFSYQIAALPLQSHLCMICS